MERQQLLDGDSRRIPVLRITSPADLTKMMEQMTEKENLVPFVISDKSFTDSPIGWVEGAADETTIHLSYAALAKRRQHDYQKMLYDKIQASLLSMQPFTVVFGKPSAAGTGNPQQSSSSGFGDMPNDWKMTNFFDDHSFPLELFDPRIFHGRYKADYFLPLEKRCPWLRPPPPVAESPAPLEENEAGESVSGEESGSANAEEADATAADSKPVKKFPQAPTVHLLRFCVVALSKVDSEKGADGIRDEVIRQFSQHLPLHRTAILVLSRDGVGPPAGYP